MGGERALHIPFPRSHLYLWEWRHIVVTAGSSRLFASPVNPSPARSNEKEIGERVDERRDAQWLTNKHFWRSIRPLSTSSFSLSLSCGRHNPGL